MEIVNVQHAILLAICALDLLKQHNAINATIPIIKITMIDNAILILLKMEIIGTIVKTINIIKILIITDH